MTLVLAILLSCPYWSAAQPSSPAGKSAKQSAPSSSLQSARPKLDTLIPVRGFCVDLPHPSGLDSFVRFIHEELAPRKVNTLFLLVDYHYRFKTHPELADTFALSNAEVKKIVQACAQHHIRIIPQINLLGHQSWENHIGKLLQVYPEFDETPWVKNPVNYVWPNDDNLYCRSYCPLHPKIHEVLFAVIDELCDAFEADAFHGGMDEVFYLGERQCPRCSGHDPAALFAGEVRTLHDHLSQKGRELWIWGDRLLDGKTTGIGKWEASLNNTYRAIDLIPTDVVICDWHYERPDKTSVYFAIKGFRVITCPWRNSSYALTQIDDLLRFRAESTLEMKPRFYGIVETTWSPTQYFLNGFYNINQRPPTQPAANTQPDRHRGQTAWKCFRDMYQKIDSLGD
ncbi:MAG: family 20 glycosylhydrolase [Bacteroidetes bacterium]|nr:family 20 glycosylhydrolase [Bacteroidota bacterium]